MVRKYRYPNSVFFKLFNALFTIACAILLQDVFQVTTVLLDLDFTNRNIFVLFAYAILLAIYISYLSIDAIIYFLDPKKDSNESIHNQTSFQLSFFQHVFWILSIVPLSILVKHIKECLPAETHSCSSEIVLLKSVDPDKFIYWFTVIYILWICWNILDVRNLSLKDNSAIKNIYINKLFVKLWRYFIHRYPIEEEYRKFETIEKIEYKLIVSLNYFFSILLFQVYHFFPKSSGFIVAITLISVVVGYSLYLSSKSYVEKLSITQDTN